MSGLVAKQSKKKSVPVSVLRLYQRTQSLEAGLEDVEWVFLPFLPFFNMVSTRRRKDEMFHKKMAIDILRDEIGLGGHRVEN